MIKISSEYPLEKIIKKKLSMHNKHYLNTQIYNSSTQWLNLMAAYNNTQQKREYHYTKKNPLSRKSEEKLRKLLKIDAEIEKIEKEKQDKKDNPDKPGITWQQILNKIKEKEKQSLTGKTFK